MMKVLLFTLGLALAVLLMGFGVSYYVPKIEQDITARSIAALTAESLAPQEAGYNFDISGRDVSLHGVVASEADRVRIGEIASGVDGVRSVDNQITVAAPPAMPEGDSLHAVAPVIENVAEVLVEEAAEAKVEAMVAASMEVDAILEPSIEVLAPPEQEKPKAPLDSSGSVVAPAKVVAVVDPCQEGLAKIVEAENLQFDTGSAVLKPSSDKVLDKIVAAAKGCQDSVIHVFGHTDNVGESAANKALSLERAKAVGVALSVKGISQKIRATGLGGKFPVADNETEAGRAKNRRIEFKVYKVDGGSS